jgi:hypothetical protein
MAKIQKPDGSLPSSLVIDHEERNRMNSEAGKPGILHGFMASELSIRQAFRP